MSMSYINEMYDECRRLVQNPMFIEDPTDWQWIRPDIREAIDAYNNQSMPYIGDFLLAVMRNDLSEAMGRADMYNRLTLPAIVSYVYMKTPGMARRTGVDQWITDSSAGAK